MVICNLHIDAIKKNRHHYNSHRESGPRADSGSSEPEKEVQIRRPHQWRSRSRLGDEILSYWRWFTNETLRACLKFFDLTKIGGEESTRKHSRAALRVTYMYTLWLARNTKTYGSWELVARSYNPPIEKFMWKCQLNSKTNKNMGFRKKSLESIRSKFGSGLFTQRDSISRKHKSEHGPLNTLLTGMDIWGQNL